MDVYTLTSIIISLAVAISYLNYRFFKLQSTIAIMVGAMLISLLLLLLHHLGLYQLSYVARQWLLQANFRDLLLKGMLSYLLFAGALFLDLDMLKSNKWEIGVLATVSTAISTFILGSCLFVMLPVFHLSLPYIYCLLFGALISPTDPIAVLATFKELGVSKKLATCVSGESLFNDGVGIVIFLALYHMVTSHASLSWQHIALLFVRQVIGGLSFGFVLGYIARYLIKDVADVKIIIFITLAIVTGGYAIALAWGLSGPLAMVVAGIMVGTTLRQHHAPGLSSPIYIFWQVLDEVLNALLFLLVGFELLTLHISLPVLIAAGCSIPLVLLVRLVTVAVPMKILQLKRIQEPRTIAILTWGGLRGALALALAFSLPNNSYKEIVLPMTYVIVAFSIIVQGYTIGLLVKKR